MQCDLPAELRPLLVRWWEDFHFPELLALPGFLHARRAELIAPSGRAPIVTMYGLSDPAAADQPRPPDFTLMPTELDGKVTFNRRILRRISEPPGSAEPVGTAFLQLLRPATDEPDSRGDAEHVRQWPGVLAASCWRTVANAPHTTRAEVVHLGGSDLIHAELAADDAQVLRILASAGSALPGWAAGAYRQNT